MNRRELLGGAVAGLGVLSAFGFSEVAFARHHKKGGHHKHALDPNNPYAKAIATAIDCAKKGEACIEHCKKEIAKGNKSLEACLVAAEDMVAGCQAFVHFAHHQSKNIKKVAVLCAEFCRECEKACKDHIEHHKTCKECYEACGACAKECESIA